MKIFFALRLVGPALAGLTLMITTNLPAQIAIPALTTAITENFDSLGVTATATLPAYWQMTAAGDTTVSWADPTNVTATTLQASSGSPTGGGRYNWGQSSTDRAIGFMTSGSYASPNSILAYFSNNTGTTVDQLSLSFDYERYRLNTNAASISFFYSPDGTTWTAAASGDSGAFSTGSSSYGFATPVSSVSAAVTLTGLNLGPGADFYLRWAFATNGGNSQGLGLDNFSLTASAVPEPSTYAALAGAAALLGASWQRRRRHRGPATQPLARILHTLNGSERLCFSNAPLLRCSFRVYAGLNKTAGRFCSQPGCQSACRRSRGKVKSSATSFCQSPEIPVALDSIVMFRTLCGSASEKSVKFPG